MLTVRFYLLPPQDDLKARLTLTCQLAARAYQEKLKTVIHCATEDLADQLDHMLWHFSRCAFIPHARLEDPLSIHAAVILLVPPERIGSADVQIDLSDEIHPDIPARCTRIFEIVTQHEAVLSVTRKRFKFYTQRGWQPEIYPMGTNASA